MKVALVLAMCATAGLVSASEARSSTSQRADSAQEPTLVAQGRSAFELHCAACHGKGPSEGRAPLLPGTFALSLKYKGELPAALEDRADLTFEFIEYIVRYGVFSMPPLGKTEVSDRELRAIAAYLAFSSKNPEGPIMTGPNKVSGSEAE